MPLRKSTCLTPQRLDAARRNSQRSTGPRSEAGKERMKMNAVKHGCDAAPENEAAVMRALGEDPERYAALQRELSTTYGPGDAFWDQQVADLGKLYWRRNRIERMQTGLMRRALLAVEERQRTRRRQMADVTFDASQVAIDLNMGEPKERCVQLRLLLSQLGVMRAQVGARVFTLGQPEVIKTRQQEAIGWRPARLRFLLWVFLERAGGGIGRNDEQKMRDYENQCMGGEAGAKRLYQELVRLLGEEVAEVEAELAEEVAAQEEMDAIERDACLAPAGETWEMLLRQEAALDRSIDRKVRILLTLRQEHARESRGGSQTAPAREPDDRAAEELSKVVGLDAGTESPAEENAGETSKSPEQSENVIENKGPAAEGVAA